MQKFIFQIEVQISVFLMCRSIFVARFPIGIFCRNKVVFYIFLVHVCIIVFKMPISVLSINNGNAELNISQPVMNNNKCLHTVSYKKLKMVLKVYWFLARISLANLLKGLSVYEVNMGFYKYKKLINSYLLITNDKVVFAL